MICHGFEMDYDKRRNIMVCLECLDEKPVEVEENTGKQVVFSNGKKMGVIRKDGTFMMFKNSSKHLFRMFNGWSVNLPLIGELKDKHVLFIEVYDRDTKILYKTTLADFLSFGIPYRNRKGEKDYQLVLPLPRWERIEGVLR